VNTDFVWANVAEDDNKQKEIHQKVVVLKEKILKQIRKIGENPQVGKPMRNVRKGTRELYVKPFRLSYIYFKDKDEVVIFDLYHKKFQ